MLEMKRVIDCESKKTEQLFPTVAARTWYHTLNVAVSLHIAFIYRAHFSELRSETQSVGWVLGALSEV